jgi:sec-independent protein translocase protein TatA
MLLALGLGAMEIVVILVVVLLVFGPSKLPQLGEGIGKMLRGFKKEMKAIDDDAAADESKAKALDKDGDEIDVTPKKTADAGGSSKAKA